MILDGPLNDVELTDVTEFSRNLLHIHIIAFLIKHVAKIAGYWLGTSLHFDGLR